uniref:Glycosyltransferase, group 2 family protein n=1 Tax=Toxoplasma gondii COUG TaxID=1074873 RepID=A0A2G8YDH5_TOXGO|nr:glycosyltransferase, group 2 family protein [Toxoplasma gondii COUG]
MDQPSRAPSILVLVFSKDRAAQLFLCLHSFFSSCGFFQASSCPPFSSTSPLSSAVLISSAPRASREGLTTAAPLSPSEDASSSVFVSSLSPSPPSSSSSSAPSPQNASSSLSSFLPSEDQSFSDVRGASSAPAPVEVYVQVIYRASSPDFEASYKLVESLLMRLLAATRGANSSTPTLKRSRHSERPFSASSFAFSSEASCRPLCVSQFSEHPASAPRSSASSPSPLAVSSPPLYRLNLLAFHSERDTESSAETRRERVLTRSECSGTHKGEEASLSDCSEKASCDENEGSTTSPVSPFQSLLLRCLTSVHTPGGNSSSSRWQDVFSSPSASLTEKDGWRTSCPSLSPCKASVSSSRTASESSQFTPLEPSSSAAPGDELKSKRNVPEGDHRGNKELGGSATPRPTGAEMGSVKLAADATNRREAKRPQGSSDATREAATRCMYTHVLLMVDDCVWLYPPSEFFERSKEVDLTGVSEKARSADPELSKNERFSSSSTHLSSSSSSISSSPSVSSAFSRSSRSSPPGFPSSSLPEMCSAVSSPSTASSLSSCVASSRPPSEASCSSRASPHPAFFSLALAARLLDVCPSLLHVSPRLHFGVNYSQPSDSVIPLARAAVLPPLSLPRAVSSATARDTGSEEAPAAQDSQETPSDAIFSVGTGKTAVEAGEQDSQEEGEREGERKDDDEGERQEGNDAELEKGGQRRGTTLSAQPKPSAFGERLASYLDSRWHTLLPQKGIQEETDASQSFSFLAVARKTSFGDFGMALDLSCTLYRSADLLCLLQVTLFSRSSNPRSCFSRFYASVATSDAAHLGTTQRPTPVRFPLKV